MIFDIIKWYCKFFSLHPLHRSFRIYGEHFIFLLVFRLAAILHMIDEGYNYKKTIKEMISKKFKKKCKKVKKLFHQMHE